MKRITELEEDDTSHTPSNNSLQKQSSNNASQNFKIMLNRTILDE